MQIYNDKKKRVGVLKDFANRSITSTLDTGDKELAFEYPADGPMVEELREECYIRTKTDEFVLKAVERGEKKNKYTATLNVEDLEGTVFPGGFETVELTITDALNFAFEDTGWKVGTCEIMKRRTIRIEESTTAWAVLQQSLSTYRCECKIDSLTKTVNIYEQVGEDKGCYFMDGLNLRKLTLKSDTYDFYTRIYPIGKDGLTPFEALNVPYIENHQYSEKVKSYVWKDERYTRTTSLIEDATAKIEEMSRPYKAFTADVVDLAKRSKKYKNILSYGIGDTITLISKKNRVKEKQRIVKITEYPEHPEKNTVEISNARKTFAEIQKSEAELSKTEAIDVSNTVTKKILENGYYTKTEVESCIAATEKKITLSVGETYITKETYADGITEVKKDATAKAEKAEAAAKADTTNRLKSYSTTEEMKAAIELVAEGITSTVSKTYVTQAIYEKGIEDAKTDATTKANAAAADAKADTTNRLKSYSTTLEMESKIQQAADAITSTVSKTYVTLEEYDTGIEDTKNDATTKANAAAADAKADTTARLKSYSTTTEMKTAIQQAADSITSTVSSTYVTKADYDTGITDAKNDATTKANAAAKDAKADTASKLKSYSTTTQMNTAIKQAADSITSTVSKTYVTLEEYDTGIEDTKNDATTKANAAAADAKADTTARLKSYSTTTEMKTAIQQAADSITSTVSSTYVTKADYDTGITDAKNDATTKANAAAKDAKADTASKLKSYSTTTQMNTAIKQAADSITSTVSKTYVTQTTYEGGIADAKADATTKANNAEANAKADTASKLKSYSTTTQMNTAIKQSADAITLEVEEKTDSDTVKSLISQAADSIRLKAAKISWSSTYSSMTEAGKLTCTSANITGDVTTKQAWNKTYKITELKQGVLKGYMGDTQTGLLDMSAWYTDELRHTALKGFDWLHLQAGTTAIVEVSDGSFEVQSDTTKIYGATSVSAVGEDITCSASNSVTIKSDSGTATLKGKLVQIWGDTTKMYNLPHVTSGGHVVFGSDGQTLSYLASSSKRYKDHVAEITEEEARKILEIKPVWFRYKEGYLTEKDPLNGEQIPGFYAEDVEEAMPVIAWKNENGQTENWDERKLLPFMLFLIQELYRRTEKNESHAGN